MQRELVRICNVTISLWNHRKQKENNPITAGIYKKQAYLLFYLIMVCGLNLFTGCAGAPKNKGDLCAIFKEKRGWYKDAERASKRWGSPIPVMMAMIYKESSFERKAKPPRKRILWIIPWSRPSTAYGYSQALDTTWDAYKQETGAYPASLYDLVIEEKLEPQQVMVGRDVFQYDPATGKVLMPASMMTEEERAQAAPETAPSVPAAAPVREAGLGLSVRSRGDAVVATSYLTVDEMAAVAESVMPFVQQMMMGGMMGAPQTSPFAP